jgi:hypothetical protein
MEWLKHAFATDPPGPAQPTDEQRRIVETLVREVVRRRLTTPALLTLELSRPLTFVSAQVLHFFEPFVSSIGGAVAYQEFALFLEQRGSVDYICERIEAIEHERDVKETVREHRGAD